MQLNEGLAEAIRVELMPPCRATTLAGSRCRKHAEGTNGLCPVHDPTRQCHGWTKHGRRCGNRCPPDEALCGRCQREEDEHEALGWDECMDEGCAYHNDEHVETQGRTR